MIAKRIDGFTRVFNAPADWDGENMLCGALPVMDVEVAGDEYMISAWEPTPSELDALLQGASVKLWIRGVIHPVVAISVGDVS